MPLKRKPKRNGDCSGCEFEETIHGIGCYMFFDRSSCSVKRPKRMAFDLDKALEEIAQFHKRLPEQID